MMAKGGRGEYPSSEPVMSSLLTYVLELKVVILYKDIVKIYFRWALKIDASSEKIDIDYCEIEQHAYVPFMDILGPFSSNYLTIYSSFIHMRGESSGSYSCYQVSNKNTSLFCH